MNPTTSTLGTLAPTSGNGWVTWKDAKRQVRAIARKAGHKPTGFFRARRENRGELLIHIDGGGTISARRKIGGAVVFSGVVVKSVDDLTPEQLAAILAQG